MGVIGFWMKKRRRFNTCTSEHTDLLHKCRELLPFPNERVQLNKVINIFIINLGPSSKYIYR